jgi:hypothetical protein
VTGPHRLWLTASDRRDREKAKRRQLQAEIDSIPPLNPGALTAEERAEIAERVRAGRHRQTLYPLNGATTRAREGD